jgi:hypothetical protein
MENFAFAFCHKAIFFFKNLPFNMSQSVEVLKRKGKTESQIWTYLSNIEKPYKLKEVQCVHFGEIVKTWQNVDRDESHLKKCQEFKRKHAVNSGDRPLFLDEKRAKIGDKSTKPSRCSPSSASF